MNILVTGSKGMVGSAFINYLKRIKEGKNLSRNSLIIDDIYEYDLNHGDLDSFCASCDYVFNFAGVNRADTKEAYQEGNYGFMKELIACLNRHHNNVPIMYASSIQASLIGRYEGSIYGQSKKEAEELLFNYEGKVAIYRFPNVMGHSKPNYNSAVSTFCDAIANDKPYTVNDPSTKLELLYIDDLLEGLLDLLEGKEKHCDYDGLNIIENENGKYCYIGNTHIVTLGEIVDLLKMFKKSQTSLIIPPMPDNSFAKKLYSLYLTYLPTSSFKQAITMNIDDRGSFSELLHTDDLGQVSVNITKPGITKGNHYHNSKWEIFIVVKGQALIKERNILTNQVVEYEVSGDHIEAIYMIPGWTHSITNLSSAEDLVTIMYCNENFNKDKPDTYYLKV